MVKLIGFISCFVFYVYIFILLIGYIFSKGTILIAVSCGDLHPITAASTYTNTQQGAQNASAQRPKQLLKYSEDAFFSSPSVVHHAGKELQIRFTNDNLLYENSRTHQTLFHYELPFTEDGVYTLVLKFAETQYQRQRKRIFNISIGDITVFPNLDLIEQLQQPFSAFHLYIEVQHAPGDTIKILRYTSPSLYYRQSASSGLGKQPELNIVQNQCESCSYTGKVLRIQFQKVQGQPFCNAILLQRGGLDNSDMQDYFNAISSWKASSNEQKKLQQQMRRTLAAANATLAAAEDLKPDIPYQVINDYLSFLKFKLFSNSLVFQIHLNQLMWESMPPLNISDILVNFKALVIFAITLVQIICFTQPEHKNTVTSMGNKNHKELQNQGSQHPQQHSQVKKRKKQQAQSKH